LNEDGSLLGKISLSELVANEKLKTIEAILDENPVCLESGSSVESAREVAANFIGEALPVISADTRVLLGIVSEADIFTAVLKTQNEVNSLEKA
jgi:Mg/Co/Ni transporter MgtE